MEYTLKDYQDDAVKDVLDELASARDLYHGARSRVSSVALTATTGAGKTVMAASVIEALFFGNDEADFAADPGAVVLWFSDDPSLNQQTRNRLDRASGRLRNRLVTIEHPFRYRKLQPGTVYFLNTSKLSANSLLVRTAAMVDSGNALPGLESRPDEVPFTLWDTLRATIEDPSLTLYMVLDEAHRGFGVKTSADKPTIVRRLINGHSGVPPMPIVWGISATVRRFEEAMQAAQVQDTRIRLRTVAVDPVRIQESGLLKDSLELEFPEETGEFNTVLLRRGVRHVKEMTEAWAAYSAAQREPEPVVPLLVLQVPNKPDPEAMARALDVIFDEWRELPPDGIAHVFGEHTQQVFGPHAVPYVSPERVQDATHIRVLLAKDAISTGWDCPRAEMLVSFRPAEDETHITQLLGRMVRTPLARRIEGNDVLNSVKCVVPRFNRQAAEKVLDAIITSGELGNDGEGMFRVLVEPELMTPNPSIPEGVWTKFAELPTQTLPRKGASPVKRLTAIAHALAADGLVPEAGRFAHDRLHGVLAGLAAQYASELAVAEEEVRTVRGGMIRGTATYGMRSEGDFTEAADDMAIRDAYRQGTRVIAPDIARSYVDVLAPDDDDEQIRDAYVRVAALALLPYTRDAIDAAADAITRGWLSVHRVAIKKLPEGRQSLYAELTALAKAPQTVPIALPQNRMEETRTLTGEVLAAIQTRPKHLLSDSLGLFPIGKLNPDEIAVLDTELARSDIMAWYRNPIGGRDALGIAYQDARAAWRLLRPDFVFFTESGGDVKPSIVDPHGAWLPDSLYKLRGMADFAEEHADGFHRLESISRIEGELIVLDFTQEGVRGVVRNAQDADAAYRLAGVRY
ncbi:DEAD/DEAH box helicase family protein [Agromyces indicus]|uniref:DEAD/DEAH box helicase family protein n=1 Tax=Agromyces indicus TaxID=758919 RepID=A0ABU1FFL2_9MICO|nr:DEAD/DEAH box helicase family protein [Agromyces indicus]MDR5690553.1 DEAD/DEAH box helicase family protein [Agromyces indicus]